jgi:hypothetical protein
MTVLTRNIGRITPFFDDIVYILAVSPTPCVIYFFKALKQDLTIFKFTAIGIRGAKIVFEYIDLRIDKRA